LKPSWMALYRRLSPAQLALVEAGVRDWLSL